MSGSPNTSEPPTAIEVRNLTRRFGDFTAVNSVSFTVSSSETFAFLGPNGAGKTTTIKMLTTLLKPTAGSIRINGVDPTLHPAQARRSFGIVFQDPSLDDELTASENMQLHAALYHVPKEEGNHRTRELLHLLELWDRRNDYVKQFSGGMKRRLEIARGLLHHPKILFLDEPTVGLDPQTRKHIWGYIQELNANEGVTVFFTTHYMDEADRVASRIAIMDHGKIVAEGSPAALKEKAGCESLEDAFIALTGHALRDEEATSLDWMRGQRKVWGRR